MPPAGEGILVRDMRKTGMKDMFGLFHRPERSFPLFWIDYPTTHNNYIIILERCQAIFETNSDSSHVRTSFLNSFRFLFNQMGSYSHYNSVTL